MNGLVERLREAIRSYEDWYDADRDHLINQGILQDGDMSDFDDEDGEDDDG